MDPVTIAVIAAGSALLLRLCSSNSSRFRFRRKNGSWRAYFNGQPPSTTHIYHDSDGYYVCWDRPLRTEQEARNVANKWMRQYGR